MFSAVFVFQVFRPLKVLKKFWKNYIKNQRPGSFRNHQGSGGGPPQGLQKGPWHGPTLGRAREPAGCPLRLYLSLGVETPNINMLFVNSSLYRRRRRFKIGAAWRSCPDSIAMDASRIC